MHRDLLLCSLARFASPTFLLSLAPIEINARGGDPNCFWLQAMHCDLLLSSLARFASPTFLLSPAPIEMNARLRGSKLLLASGNVPGLAALQFGSLHFAYFSIVSGSN